MQEFPFAVPAQAQMLNYGVIALVAIVGIVSIAFGGNKTKRIMTAVIMIPLLFFLVRTLLPAGGDKVTLDGALTVHSSHATITVAKGDVISADVVDIKTDPELRTVTKTNGAAIGDYKVGWFRLANGKQAFVMTATPQVVAFELADKYVMVAPGDFAGFVKAVNDGFVPVK